MIRAFQWDLARQVERLDWLLAQLPSYADWGYTELYLHLEDAIAYPSLPGVARRDAYSHGDIGRLVEAADHVGIKVVPIANLLGHTQYLIKVPGLRDLNELQDTAGNPLEHGQICPVHPRTLEIAGKVIDDVAPFCSAGKVHVGLDESFHLGKHPLSQKEVSGIGLAAHFARYVGRLRELTRSRGLRMGMWADMLYFLPEAIPLLPTDVAAYEWYYYPFRRRPRVELFNFAESDVGEKLVARGLEYWGCPMNGAFRHEPMPHFSDRLANITSWWQRCHRLNAAGMLITSWEPNRLAMELTTVVDAAAASLWLDSHVLTPRDRLAHGFARVFGRHQASGKKMTRGRRAADAALTADTMPFGGYPRWQVNQRWDVVSRRESIEPYRREERRWRGLRRQAGLPAPLRASFDLAWAFAFRDVWLRETIHFGLSPARMRAFRRALHTGLRAARRMWTRTRDPADRGPNEQIILADLQRIESACRGAMVFSRGWQLCYRVHNFEPAVQLVGVEQQSSDGTWGLRQSCYTIEFQARAARPRGGFVRAHAASIEWDGDAEGMPKTRLVVRGIGRVKVSDVALTDGRRIFRPRWKTKILGQRAPARGWPELDAAVNRAVVTLRFSRAP